jgi:hypothetical protein
MSTERISVAKIQQLYDYDKMNGLITRRSTSRIVLPHPVSGDVEISDTETKKRRKFIYRNLAYLLGSGKELSANQKVFPMDLDENNIRWNNLKVIDKSVYKTLHSALRNVKGELKIQQHDSDKHAYLVQWIDEGKSRYNTFYEISAAEKFKAGKMLEFVKMINHYTRSL